MIDLSSYVGTRRKVRVERNRPSDRLVNGYILEIRNGLILIHPFDDFEPDGYAVIRVRDVVGVRSNHYERLWDRMLSGEGLLGGLDAAPEVDLSGMRSVIVSAAARFRFVVIECEDEHESLQDFYLGEVIDVVGDIVRFRCLNALANWDEEIVEIRMDEITKVEFDTPYIQRFTKYIVT